MLDMSNNSIGMNLKVSTSVADASRAKASTWDDKLQDVNLMDILHKILNYL